MASSLFGWELLYSSVEKDIRNNQDLLVCLSHLVLVSNGFKCIGLGESKNIDGSENKSEALPKGWNQDYAIRYVYQGRLYNFKATSLDDGVSINLNRVDERLVSFVELNCRAVVQLTGTLKEMIPDHINMIDMIKKLLINKVIISKKEKDVSCQTESQPQHTSRYSADNRSNIDPYYNRNRQSFPAVVPPQYGRSDLDPFGGLDPLRVPNRIFPPGGGGMIFPGPSNPGMPGGNLGVPPGSIPPGARFDPFRPPDLPGGHGRRPRSRPDNDEFHPPDYDDMFM